MYIMNNVYNVYNVYNQEFIRDKSVQPRIPTVNDILQKWRSKTSHVAIILI